MNKSILVAGYVLSTAVGAAWAAPSSPSAPGAVGDATAGKAAFTACASCHQVGPNARAGFGPQLNGVIGRKAGSTADYRYSTALASSRIIWSEASLSAFIKDADRTVPGTKMRFSSFGYGDRRITDLLAYLRTFPARP